MPDPATVTTPDPWSAFLDWLQTLLVPDWGGLIDLLPFALVVLLIGPIVTLIVLLWAWYLLHRTRGRVRTVEEQPVSAPLDAEGRPVFPPNVPYCGEHALIHLPRERTCAVDGADLAVLCPVDATVRSASLQTCPGCGTRYVLGSAASTRAIVPAAGPPEGGAAVA
jgi:hypothetical protein